MMPTFKLYVDSNFWSPYAMSAFVTLVEKGVPFDVHTVDLSAGENFQGDYMETRCLSSWRPTQSISGRERRCSDG